MITNIKYLFVIWIASTFSSAFAQESKIRTSEEPFHDLLWMELNEADSVPNDVDKYKGIVINRVSASMMPILATALQSYPSLLIGGNVMSLKESLDYPSPEAFKHLNSAFSDRYQTHILDKQELLHWALDPTVNPGNFSFTKLEMGDSDSALVAKLLQSNAWIIRGNRLFWNEKIIRLCKKNKDLKRSLPAIIASATSAANDLAQHATKPIPYDLSNLAVQSNASFYFRNPVEVGFQHTLFENSFSRLTKQDYPFKSIPEKVLVLTTKNSKSFESSLSNYARFATSPFSPLTPSDSAAIMPFENVFVQLEGSITSAQVDYLSAIPKSIRLLITFLGPAEEAQKLKIFPNVLWHPDANEITRKVAPQIFFDGISSAPTRLSFGLPEQVAVNGSRLEEIDKLISLSLEDSIFPGAQVLIARKGKVIYHKPFGYHSYEKKVAITPQTIYDLASVSKVLAIVPAIMTLDSLGLIDLDANISTYLPDLIGTNKEHMTIRDILAHQAGLYPYWPFWKNTIKDDRLDEIYFRSDSSACFPFEVAPGLYGSRDLPDSLWKWSVDSKLADRQDDRASFEYLYSDMGFIFLKRIIEEYLHMSLDTFVDDAIWTPIGMRHTTYLPLRKFPPSLIAPTEEEKEFRGSLIQGTVHDQTTALMGGIAGRAGIFSNALDLAIYLQMMMNGSYGGHAFFSQSLIQKYTSRQYPANRRGLGWDKADPEGAGNTSYLASQLAFGHAGFSGTSMWVDPQFELICVVLSNRIHPSAENVQIVEQNIRTRIQDIVYQAIIDFEKVNGCK